MTGTYAPTHRARRILIAVLAFALVAAVAFAASIAPAGADDPKEYKAEVGVPAGSIANVTPAAGSGTTVTFTNVSSTATQLAGSFSVEFPAGFLAINATSVSASGAQSWVILSGAGDNPVVVSAASGGERIGVGESVEVEVSFTAPDSGIFTLTTAGDQQAGGVFEGGNLFTRVDPEPTLIVTSGTPTAASCTAGEQGCEASEPGGEGAGTATCPTEGCPKGGIVLVDFLGDQPDGSFLWLADTNTGLAAGDAFYLIIDLDDELKKFTILTENADGEIVSAKNCNPPHRSFFCVDTNHDDFNRKTNTFPLRFPAQDPAGGYK